MAWKSWRILAFIAIIEVAILGTCAAVDLENVLVVETPKKDQGPSRLTIVHKPDSVSLVKKVESIPAQDISPVIALALGLTPVKEVNWKGLLVGNIFKRPYANVLISITDVPVDNQFGIDHPFTSYRVTDSPKSATGNVLLDMIHGPNHDNVATYVSKVFEKKPLTVSISASYEVAQAGYGNEGRSYSIFLDDLADKFQVSSSSDDRLFDSLSLSKEAMLKEFENFDFGRDCHFDVEKKQMSVTLPGGRVVAFNMDKRSDYMFFAEIFAMLKSSDIIKARKDLIHDDAPDVYSYTFSSIKALDMEHGKNSDQVDAAIRVLHFVIPKIYQSFNEIYDGQALIELLTHGSSGRLVFEHPEQLDKAHDVVKPYLHNNHKKDFEHRLPFIHLKKDIASRTINGLCHSLNHLFGLFNFKSKVHCHEESSNARVGRSLMAAASTDSPITEQNLIKKVNVSPVYTSDYPVYFNIILWLMIILVVALYVTAAVMWDMDPGRDSIIYRMTSQRIKTE